MKKFLLIIFFTVGTNYSTFSQLTDSLIKPYDIHAPYKLSSYVFYDFVRQTGIGLDYRVTSKFELDAQFGAFYRGGLVASFSRANDYFDNYGFCVALKTKFFTGPKRHFFIGTYSAINNYGYKQLWEGTDRFRDKDVKTQELRDKHVNSYTGLGLSIGLKQYIKNKWTVEEFVVLASEQGGQVHERIYTMSDTVTAFYTAGNQKATYPYDIYYKINRTIYYPVYHGFTIIVNVGIKIGFKIL